MLVYGDPKFSAPLRVLIENCRSRIRRMDVFSLDDWRSLLIFAGQLEQAVADCVVEKDIPSRQLRNSSADLTDCLARFFRRKFISDESKLEKGILTDTVDRMLGLVTSAPALGEQLVTAKIPEGYAFYALFPEQYCVTALNWARQHTIGNEVLVVGIRSIGTSLSAVVKETLLQTGWKSSRFTVRPGGHPFHRQLDLDAKQFVPGTSVLIVDEGPGISGSSMAAVAEAFISAGCCDVSFLPGHRNDPHSAAPDVMEIWRRVPRYVTSIEKVEWNHLSLEDSLLARAKEFGHARACESIQNISGGLWQKLASKSEVEWPTSPPQFERMKFLCTGREGASVLWKFAGLHSDANGTGGCTAVFADLSRLATLGYCPKPLGTCTGFIAMPWIEGARLTRANAKDTSLWRRIGNYIFDAAWPGWTASQNKTAIERIAEMLYWNTKESLGETFAQSALVLKDAAFETGIDLTYGDGHLAPHEWVHADGKVLKLDAGGHSVDHTVVGEQSVLWDIAGAWVEWDLNLQTAVPLLEAIEEKEIHVNLEALAFYRAAYLAFRVGLFSMGVTQVSDAGEKMRFATGRAFYLRKLADVLKVEAMTAQSAG